MKILLSTDTVGGVWDHTATLARELDRAGHEVLVAAIGEPRERSLAALPEGVQVVWRRYRLEWMPSAGADVEAAGEWLRGLAAVWGPDVVHLNQMAYAARTFAAPVLVAVHSDVLSWLAEVQGQSAGAEWEEYTGWVTRGLAGADAVVAPSRYQAELVARHYGVEVPRAIHNGIAPPAAEPEPSADVVALSVGRLWDAGKGVDVLDEAAGLLGGEVPVHVLGATEAPHGERRTMRHVVAHGRVERGEVDAWMGRSSIYVAASRYEPFGLAPLEAALQGCALVLSDIGSFRELWDGCAEFFPSGDAPALAEALRRLASDPRRREQLARAARTRALRRFTAPRMAAEYIELYRELARRRTPPRGRLRPLLTGT